MINLLPFNRTALLLEGDSLRVVQVRSTLTGATADPIGVIDGFATTPITALRSDAQTIASRASSEFVLVLPASMCASRPVPITAKNWSASAEARDELVEAYFPFSAREALTGLLEFTPDGSPAARGAMFVAPKAPIDDLRERVATLFGSPVREVLASTMCLPALGLQHVERAVVVERGAGDLATTLAWGRPERVAEPFDDDEPGATLYAVGGADGIGQRALPVSPDELAIAACVLPYVPGVKYRSLDGHGGARLDRRLPLAAAVTLLALAELAASSWVTEARYRAGIDRINDEMAAMSGELDGVQRLRNDTTRLTDSLESIGGITSSWRSVLPELREALAVVPGEGFVHRVELTPTRVTVAGESATSLAVLEALENTDAFENARQTGGVTRTQRDLEMFALQARRVSQTGGER